jgi:predicted RNase H-like HicB family nuclease
MNTREYNFWFVFKRAEDVPGEWVGHCLDIDVVTQGTSLEHALAMLGEACLMTVCDDIGSHREPLDRRAPQSYWDIMYNMVQHGRSVDFHSLDEKSVGFVACQVQFKCQFVQPSRAQEILGQVANPIVPLTWAEVTSKAQDCRC